MIKIVIGLGNPGAAYTGTRHNAGFWLVDALAAERQWSFSAKSKFKGDIASGGGIIALKPQTFMNLSGEAAGALARFYSVETPQLLVVHDEVDLPPGTARLKHGGGDAGHRGLADISRKVGKDYWRLRIGVGKPPVGGVHDYVLQKPPAGERDAINRAIGDALFVWDDIINGDFEGAMRQLHATDK